MKLKKGDNVIVITGKDKGKKGKILEVFPSATRVIVEEVNVAHVHTKSRVRGHAGEIIKRAMPIHASNVMIVDPSKNMRTRVGIKRVGEKNVRVTKISGFELK